MATEGMPTWPSGQTDEEVGLKNQDEATEKKNSLGNSDKVDVIILKPGSSDDKSGPVDHLLRAVGVILGDKVSSDQRYIAHIVNTGDSPKISNVPVEDGSSQVSNNDNTISRSNSTLYTCEICKKEFSKRSELKQHNFTHTGHLKYKCNFEDCGWSFHTKYKLARHMMVHSSNKKHMCPVDQCGKSFAEGCSLKAHAESHHKKIECPFEACDGKFTSIRKFEVHRQKCHAVKPFVCEEDKCNMEFETELRLNNHILSHGKCKCSECNKLFQKKSQLVIHMRSHTNDRPFRCTEEGCNAAFTTTYRLNRHMKNHSDLRPFSCKFDGCSAKFKRHDHLKAHVTQHSGEKPFFCTRCPSKFTALSTLKNHMLGHTKEQIYTCPVQGCGKVYFSKATLRCHVRRHEIKIAIDSHAFIAPRSDFTSPVDSNENDVNSQDAAVALGEAACFQYINETSCIQPVTSSSLDEHGNIIRDTEKVNQNTEQSNKQLMTNTLVDGNKTTNEEDENVIIYPRGPPTDMILHEQPQCISSENDERGLDFPSSIFGSESITVPLSMTIFLPGELQTTEYLPNDYRNDHAYNRTLLSANTVALDNRCMDSAIEKSLSVSDFGGDLSMNEGFDPLMGRRSLIVENGMASFLANDDIGRMETCASEDNLNINRTFDRAVNGDNSVLMQGCNLDRHSASLNTDFNHYSKHESYVSSLMESPSHTVSEHLLNISNNPTMVDHMYSQIGPEEDDDELHIVTDDHAYEESTVNIQDIR